MPAAFPIAGSSEDVATLSAGMGSGVSGVGVFDMGSGRTDSSGADGTGRAFARSIILLFLPSRSSISGVSSTIRSFLSAEPAGLVVGSFISFINLPALIYRPRLMLKRASPALPKTVGPIKRPNKRPNKRSILKKSTADAA